MNQKKTTTLAFVPIPSLGGRLQSAMVLLKMSLAVLRGKQAYLTFADVRSIDPDDHASDEVNALQNERDRLREALLSELAVWRDISFDSDGPGDEWLKGLAVSRIELLQTLPGDQACE